MLAFWPHSATTSGNAVMSQGASINVLTYMEMVEPTDGTPFKVGVQTTDVWSKIGQQSSYAVAELQGGTSYSFIPILVPIANGTNGIGAAIVNGSSAAMPNCSATLLDDGSVAATVSMQGKPPTTVRMGTALSDRDVRHTPAAV